MADLALIESKETAKAAQAFADYVALGPSRSLAKLAEQRARQGLAKNTPTALWQLKRWSAVHKWQARIGETVSERTIALLAEATELDSETFLAISREYRRRTDDVMRDASKLDQLHAIRDRVKPSANRSPAVTVNVTIMQEAERLAADLGIPANDLLAEAERIAAAAWGDD